MIYIAAGIFFASFFILFSLFFLFRSKIAKNYKRFSYIERKLLWKMPRVYNYLFALSPKVAEFILTKAKDQQIEEDLLILMETVSSNLTGGVSVTETMSACMDKLRPPLRNEISLLLILAKQHGAIKALEHCIKKSKNVFLRIFWITLLTHHKSGGVLADNMKKLYKTLYMRINIKERIRAQLLHTKIQLIVGTVLPYFLFLIMNILYPYLIRPVMHTSLGLELLFSAFIVHGIGVYFFYIITRFEMTGDLNYSLMFEYMSFSLRNGLSISAGMNDIKDSGILSQQAIDIVSSSKSTAELILNLSTTKNIYTEHLSAILKRGYTLGIPIADDLSLKAADIIEKLEQRALRFQQTVPSKALIPLFLCIFPATYILILTPIIVEISSSSF